MTQYIVECSNGSMTGRMGYTNAVRRARYYARHASMKSASARIIDATTRKTVAGFGATQ